MGAEREHQAAKIDREQDDRHDDAEPDRLGDELAAADDGEDRGHDDGDGGQRHHADLGARADGGEGLDGVAQAAGEERRAEHQQQVADDRADQRGLDDVEHAGAQRDEGDDQLGGIAEGGVEQAADALADPGRELLGRQAEQARQRDDGDAGQDEDQQGRVRPGVVHPGGYRNGEQQPRQRRLGQDASHHLHRRPLAASRVDSLRGLFPVGKGRLTAGPRAMREAGYAEEPATPPPTSMTPPAQRATSPSRFARWGGRVFTPPPQAPSSRRRRS